MSLSAPTQIAKSYPQRGPIQQFRLAESYAFACLRYGQSKKSKLVANYLGNWDRLICNGCYGSLLSIYEVKAGTAPDDEKASELAQILLSLFNADRLREVERSYRLSEKRADGLSPDALKFVSTSEYVSKSLALASDLDWSPAIIGLCKAVEGEIVQRILVPLMDSLRHANLQEEARDKDIGRVVGFLADSGKKPPELGTFAHFLQTSLNSETRRSTSPTLAGFHRLLDSWPDSAWLSNADGFYASLRRLTGDFRNRAAHLDTMTQKDYDECKELVIGPVGMLWQLIAATQPGRQ